jgi:hypothetical protein
MRALIAGAVVTIAAAGAEGQDARSQIEFFGRALERSVLEVSHPSAVSFLGGVRACRSLRVQEPGALFILPPRQLPRSNQRVAPQQFAPRSPATARISSSENISEQEKELRDAELQALAFQQAAAMMRREVERSLSAMTQEVESMMSVGHPQNAAGLSRRGDPFFLPPDPPWHHWFDLEPPADNRTPQQMFDEVRESIARTFVEHGESLNALASGEAATVIVDFLSADVFDAAARPVRTLVVRARGADLTGMREGRLTPEELRARLVFEEY